MAAAVAEDVSWLSRCSYCTVNLWSTTSTVLSWQRRHQTSWVGFVIVEFLVVFLQQFGLFSVLMLYVSVIINTLSARICNISVSASAPWSCLPLPLHPSLSRPPGAVTAQASCGEHQPLVGDQCCRITRWLFHFVIFLLSTFFLRCQISHLRFKTFTFLSVSLAKCCCCPTVLWDKLYLLFEKD